jgi:hypothetical protein
MGRDGLYRGWFEGWLEDREDDATDVLDDVSQLSRRSARPRDLRSIRPSPHSNRGSPLAEAASPVAICVVNPLCRPCLDSRVGTVSSPVWKGRMRRSPPSRGRVHGDGGYLNRSD